MGQCAAKEGDHIQATDMHLVQPPGASPVMVPHSFDGVLDGGLSSNVNIMGKPAATVDSTATNTPAHIPQGGSFVNSPSNKATIKMGSSTVKINRKKAARNGDTAMTCNDPADRPVGTVSASGTVMIG